MEILVTCVGCKGTFDILRAKWCSHKVFSSLSTKVCPYCGVCACDKKDEFIEVRLIPPIRDINVLFVKNKDIWVEGDPTRHPKEE